MGVHQGERESLPLTSSAHRFHWRIRRKEGIHLGPHLSLEWFSAVTLPAVGCLVSPTFGGSGELNERLANAQGEGQRGT